MILELIMDSLASAGLAFIATGWKIKRDKGRVEPDSFGAYPWMWKHRHGPHKKFGFLCPKCTSVAVNSKQPLHCACEEFHKGHFHFECGDCKFKCIMRTADDKET
jgi:hypothetical protein